MRLPPLSLLLLGSLSACSGGSGLDGGPGDPGGTLPPGDPAGEPTGEPALVSVELTDAPFQHALMDEAVIRVDKITAHVESEAESGFVTLYEGPPIEIEVAALRNGRTAELAFGTLPTGTWRQMRLYVASAYLRLSNGNLYTTEDDTLHLTSQSQSGFKVFFDPPLEIEKGFENKVLIDLDLTQTFHPIPGNDPENAARYRMHPVLRGADLKNGGELGGYVSAADGQDPPPDYSSATVYVVPKGETDVDKSVATTATEPDGSWTVLGLPAGEYDVIAVLGGLQGSSTGHVVEPGATTQVEIVLE